MENLLNQAKEKRYQLLNELRDLNIVIDYIEKNSIKLPPSAISKVAMEEDKIANAGRLCVEFMKTVDIVDHSKQFYTYLSSKGIVITKPKLWAALKVAGIVYNNDKKIWELSSSEQNKTSKSVKKAKSTKLATKVKQRPELKGESRTAQAGRLCRDYIKSGNKVHSAEQLHSYVAEKGVIVSKPTFTIALKKAGVFFNRDKKKWDIR